MSTPWDRAAARLNASQLRNFGEACVWQSAPPLGEEASVTLILSAPIQPEDAGAYVIAEGLASAFTPAVALGDLITARGATYTVYSADTDLSGWVKMRLRK